MDDSDSENELMKLVETEICFCWRFPWRCATFPAVDGEINATTGCSQVRWEERVNRAVHIADLGAGGLRWDPVAGTV